MVCPFCTSNKTSVYNSRPTSRLNNVWRRRRCETCKKSFTTNEMVDPSSVIKIEDGRRTMPFKYTTLLISVLRVCDHLEAPGEAADYICQTVLQKLYRQAAKNSQVLDKSDITISVLGTLRPYNLAAYVKYLSYHAPDIDPRSLNKRLKEATF